MGVLRDMFQNHLLQLLTLTAMESPSRFEADSVRDEKVKVLRAIRPMTREDVFTDTIRGQYRKYRDEPDVPPESQTATFGVVKLQIDNWRWQGVPFLLRSGKAMACQTTQIVIQFRPPPHMMFEGGPQSAFTSNRLVIQVQPAEGIQLHFYTKVPDGGTRLRQTDLSFRFQGEVRPPHAGTAPSSLSFSESVSQPLAICGQAKPCTLYRLQNFTSFWRHSRSNWSDGVTGVWPMGKTPRKGFAAAAPPVRASANPSAPPPNVRRNARLPENCESQFIGLSPFDPMVEAKL